MRTQSLQICNENSSFVSGEFQSSLQTFLVFFHYSYMFHLSFKERMKSIGCLVWPVEFFENGGARRKNAPTLNPLGETDFPL